MNNEKILFKEESFTIQGAIFEVYREMGCGFLESVYQECLEIEFKIRNIPFVSQKEMKLYYKGKKISHIFKPDFICFNQIIIELKATKDISPAHNAQLMNYLKASGTKLGLLVNFGAYPKATIKRCVL